jgi:hypothetical protein
LTKPVADKSLTLVGAARRRPGEAGSAAFAEQSVTLPARFTIVP